MISRLAIICVFLIVIGLYSAWRFPRAERLDPQPVADTIDAVAADLETAAEPEFAGPEVTDPEPRERRERSLDR